jgi:hypothetical protein
MSDNADNHPEANKRDNQKLILRMIIRLDEPFPYFRDYNKIVIFFKVSSCIGKNKERKKKQQKRHHEEH